MRDFHCPNCGQRLAFENSTCLNCGSALGFSLEQMALLVISKGDANEHAGFALGVVRRLKEDAKTAYVDDAGTVFNQDVLGAIELGYMLDCAECTVIGAIERKESRGAQFRTDYPDRNDEVWQKHITLSRNGEDTPNIGYAPVTITQWQPEERKY